MAISFHYNLIDPKTVGKGFFVEMAKRIKDEWESLSLSGNFAHGVDKYRLNRQYSTGTQPGTLYQAAFEMTDDPGTSYAQIDFRKVPPIIPKFRRIALEKIGRYQYEVTAEAVDPDAMDDRMDYEAMERANIALRGDLREMGVPDDILNDGTQDQPMSLDELAMKMNFTYKHVDASKMERSIDAVFLDNEVYDEVREKIRRDLFECGVCVLRDYKDESTGKIKIRRVDPASFGVSLTKDPMFRDCNFFFEKIYMTPDEVKAQDKQNSISDDQLKAMVEKNVERWSRRRMRGDGDESPYDKTVDQVYIPVWDIEFKSTYRVVWERKVTPSGEVIGRVDPSKSAKGETSVEDMFVWCKMKYIEGTDTVFDYGIVPHQKRPFSARWDAVSSFHAIATDMNEMEPISMVDSIIPIVDKIIIAWFKLQNIIQSARPFGFLIEIGSLEQVQIGGEDFTPLGLLDLLTQTGHLFYRAIDESGEPSSRRPVEELRSTFADEAVKWFGIMDRYMNYIRDMIGFNEFTDASTPNPRSLASVGDMATANTDNALNHIFRAERSALKRIAESVAIRVHDEIVLDDSEYYKNVVDGAPILDAKKMDSAIGRQYGIFIIDSGTAEERMSLERDIERAMELKQINVADKIRIKNMRNIKQAEMYLAIRVKQNEQDQRRFELERQRVAGDANKEAGIAVEQERQRTISVTEEEKRKTQDAKYDREERLLRLQYQLRGVDSIRMSAIDEDNRRYEAAEKMRGAATQQFEQSFNQEQAQEVPME
jgi:hypothetical protein